MYGAIGRVHCPNLVRLHSSKIHGGGIRLQDDGTTLVLHLEPVGLPLYEPPGNEADLKQAVRHVLTGVAALHAAGEVGDTVYVARFMYQCAYRRYHHQRRHTG